MGLLPFVVLAVALTVPALRAVPAQQPSAAIASNAAASTARRRLPYAILLSAGAALLLAGLTSDSIALVAILVPVGLLVGVPAFGRLTPAGTLRAARGLPAAILLRGLLTFAFSGADAYVPFALQEWRGVSATTSGVVLTAATLSWTAGAWLAAHRIERWGAPAFIRVGLAIVIVGVVSTSLVLQPAVPVGLAIVTWGVAGLGMGLAYSPLSLIVLRQATPGAEGAATSGLQLSDVLGIALGTGASGAIVAAGARIGAETWVGVAGAFGLAACVGLVGMLVARRLRAESGFGGPRSLDPVPASIEGGLANLVR
jgi:MFS family permease